jgi:hypothetical protein
VVLEAVADVRVRVVLEILLSLVLLKETTVEMLPLLHGVEVEAAVLVKQVRMAQAVVALVMEEMVLLQQSQEVMSLTQVEAVALHKILLNLKVEQVEAVMVDFILLPLVTPLQMEQPRLVAEAVEKEILVLQAETVVVELLF